MSSIGPNSLNSPRSILLRWCDRSGTSSHEQTVEIIESLRSEAIIRSSSSFDTETEVYLFGKNYTGNGVVRSCLRDGQHFVVTIRLSTDRSLPNTGWPERDPGLFVVEGFLTEEAENRILEEFDNDSRQGKLSYKCRLKTTLVSLLKLQSLSLSAGL